MPQLHVTSQEANAFAQKLRQQTTACRVRHEKLGIRKALTREQLQQTADEFNADRKVISAAKKILDSRDPAFRAVVQVRTQATQYWKAHTSPYPEPGIRLLRRDAVQAFEAKMQELQTQLYEAAGKLQEKYQELRDRAQAQLGDLFNPEDYPSRIDNQFGLDWDYPSIDPPEHLKQLHPKLYEQEVERIRGRFEEAVRLTEQAFTAKFHELVSHLADRLKGTADGKPKVFRDSAIGNLKEFFEQFRTLDVGSSGELQGLIDRAEQAVQGIAPDDLRGDADLRSRIVDQLSQIQGDMDGLMINLPTRKYSFDDAEDGDDSDDSGGVASQSQPVNPEAA